MAKGSGSIRPLHSPDGKVRGYRVVADVGRSAEGKRLQRTYTAPTRKAARDWLAETMADVKRGAFISRSSETVDALLTRWVEGRRDVRDVTRQGYRDVLVPARARLGGRRVQDVTVADVDALVAWMLRQGGQRAQGLSPRSVAATLGALSQALDLAEREGLVPRNVARIVKRPRQVRRDVDRWNAEQVRSFVKYVQDDPLAAAWLLSLTGLRRSEVLGLRWDDVDLEAGTVRVERGRVAVTPTVDIVDEPKSERSRRVVPVGMLPGVVSALRALRARQAAERLALGPAYRDTGFVVVNEAGIPPRPEWYSDRFRALGREAGLPPIHLHALRHSGESWLLSEAGLPAVDVAAMYGHTTEVLHDRYGRATPGGLAAVGAALARLYAVE